jgi:hypothetical protein
MAQLRVALGNELTKDVVEVLGERLGKDDPDGFKRTVIARLERLTEAYNEHDRQLEQLQRDKVYLLGADGRHGVVAHLVDDRKALRIAWWVVSSLAAGVLALAGLLMKFWK